ncbi:MAG: hypothetical protein ABJH08_00100 [Balneola sp.]
MSYFLPDSLVPKSRDIKKNRMQTRHSDDNIECLVFCTSLTKKEDIKYISKILNSVSEIHRWSVDLEDCENVLRIEVSEITADDIIQILKKNGVHSSLLL